MDQAERPVYIPQVSNQSILIVLTRSANRFFCGSNCFFSGRNSFFSSGHRFFSSGNKFFSVSDGFLGSSDFLSGSNKSHCSGSGSVIDACWNNIFTT